MVKIGINLRSNSKFEKKNLILDYFVVVCETLCQNYNFSPFICFRIRFWSRYNLIYKFSSPIFYNSVISVSNLKLVVDY